METKTTTIGTYSVTLTSEGLELRGRTYQFAELTPLEAMKLLAWLYSEMRTLEQLVKEQES